MALYRFFQEREYRAVPADKTGGMCIIKILSVERFDHTAGLFEDKISGGIVPNLQLKLIKTIQTAAGNITEVERGRGKATYISGVFADIRKNAVAGGA